LGSPVSIVETVIAVNQKQRERMTIKIEDAVGPVMGKCIGVLGLTFKPNTSDVRESPALDIVRALLEKGVRVRVYDPEGMDEFRKVVKDENLTYCENAYEVATKADGLVFITEWNEFRNIDLKRLKKVLAEPVIFDLRNIFEPERVSELGFKHFGVGRSSKTLPKS
jgi:UDPglucose 6-dehydrogenase